MTTAYQRCIDYMYGLHRFGIKLGLDVMANILEGLGHPEKRFKAVHIAGTNGKGSVAANLSRLLQEAGCRVGLYTSPHLIDFNERIVINGAAISDDDVVAAYEALRAAHSADRESTFFEFSTAMAFFQFAAHKVDWAIIETGMGGRLDATNILKPAVVVITNISLEHKSYLGDTISQIAFEKAGIIKPQTPVVTGVSQPEALSQIEKKAAGQNAPVYQLNRDFRVCRKHDQCFNYCGRNRSWLDLNTRLAGAFQIDNAALSLAALELLEEKGLAVNTEQVRQGLANVHWPGRLEVTGENPHLILDGAHNLAAAETLGRYLETEVSTRRITLVVGILDDKPYQAMLEHILPYCHSVIVTAPQIDRALDPTVLASAVREKNLPVQIIANVAKAVDAAVHQTPPSGIILVAGSLYVVGEARAWLLQKGLIKK